MPQKSNPSGPLQAAGFFGDISGLYSRSVRQMLEMHLRNLDTMRTLMDTWFERRHRAAEQLCDKLEAVDAEDDMQKRTEAIQKIGREWFEDVSQELNEQFETMSRSAKELVENGGIQIPVEGASSAKASTASAKTRATAP